MTFRQQKKKAKEVFSLHAEKFDNEKPYALEEIVHGCIGMVKDMKELGINRVYVAQCVEYFRQYFSVPPEKWEEKFTEIRKNLEHQLHSLS